MGTSGPTAAIDSRFSDPDATATPWPEVVAALEGAELYWLSTVRADGRPHVTPLVGVFADDAMHFCTGVEEQKARNLEHHAQVAVTTGCNAWSEGLDVVVEGTAVRVGDREALQRLADAYVAKYGSFWEFEVGGDGFVQRGHSAAVFRVEASKVLAFGKRPHAQTTYRF
jgi:general stress protein 26